MIHTMMTHAGGGGPMVPVPPGRPAGVPAGQREHVLDVPAGVIVSEDRPAQPLPSARPAVGAQHPGRGVHRVGGVVRGHLGGPVGSHRVLGERGRLELHRTLGAHAVLAPVHAAGPGPAVVRLHGADPGQHRPGQAGAGPRGVPVQGQVPARDRRRRGRRGPGQQQRHQRGHDHGDDHGHEGGEECRAGQPGERSRAGQSVEAAHTAVMRRLNNL